VEVFKPFGRIPVRGELEGEGGTEFAVAFGLAIREVG